MGPDEEWSDQKPADPMELRIYPGADADFTLYEDENDTYDYEKGMHATIRIQWDEAEKKLTIGERTGKFPGMLERRTFRVVFAGEGRGIGIEPSAQVDKTIAYSGQAVVVSR
jgi:alpha-D-xyloside xylohydrolase